ncbi:MAG: hypothetical protein L6Q98_01390 [Anaerolineae bacterium]|nr:hypothetical protein [Anaerolineae bacterium]NUQ04424.1 hypothetical protein [Anaerolineae bacterium]
MSNINRKIISAIIMAAMFLILTGALAQAGSANVETLYGSWYAEIMTVNQVQADGGHTFPALLTFGAEGTLVVDEPPLLGETSGHGNWISNDDGTIVYTFVALYSDGAGAYTGKLKVVGTLQYDSAADTWQGPFKIDIFDADDNVIAADTGTVDTVRIAVESLD